MISDKKSNPSNSEVLLSAKEAALLLQCTQDYISKLAREGKLEGTQTSKGWQVTHESLKRYEAARTAQKVSRSKELSLERKRELVSTMPLSIKHAALALVLSFVLGASTLSLASIIKHDIGAEQSAALARLESPFFATFDLGGMVGSIRDAFARLFVPTSAPTIALPNISAPNDATTTIVNNYSTTTPVIERTIVERVVPANPATLTVNFSDWATAFETRFELQVDRIFDVIGDLDTSGGGISTITDADVPDTITASNYLPLAGGTLTGGLVGTTATFDSILVTDATSTNATTTNFWLLGAAEGCAQFDTNGKLTSTGTNCGTGGGGADGNWVYFNGSGIRLATTSNQVVIGATATSSNSKVEIVGGLTLDNATTTNATTTALYVSGLASTTNLNANTATVGSATAGSLTIGTLSGVVGANSGATYATATGTVSSGAGISVTAGQYIIGSGLTITNTGVTSLAGTANQITASASTGAVTLSLPSHVIFPGTFEASAASTTNATSTNITATGIASTTALYISGIANSLLSTSNGGAVAATTVSAPLSFSGNTLSITQATASTDGYLSSTHWNVFNNKVSSSSLETFASTYKDWQISGGALVPTSTIGVIVSASSTINSLTTINSTSTNATTTNLAVTGMASTTSLTISGLGSGSTQCLQINGSGTVSGTGSACGAGGGGGADPFPSGATTTTLTFSGGFLTGTSTTGSLTATSTVKFTNYTSGALATDATGTLYTYSTSTWRFASSTLLADDNTFSGDNVFTNGLFSTASTTIIDGSTWLEVSSSGGIQLAQNGYELFLGGNSFWTLSGANPYIESADENGVLAIRATGTNGAVALSGGPSGYVSLSAGSAERLRVTSSGNVGIGTTSPASKLSVVGSTYLAGDVLATSTVTLSNYTSGALATDATGTLYTYSTSTWNFASSTLLTDSNTFSGTQTFGDLIATNATSTNATTTNLAINGALTFNGTTGTTWAAFCTSITGSADLCDGNDASGGGGGSDVNWTFFNGSGIRPSTSTNQVVIGGTATTTLLSPLAKLGVFGGASIDYASTTGITASYASTTDLVASSATTTYLSVANIASTTSLVISGLGANAGQCLTVNSSGSVSTQTCGTGSSDPFPSGATTTTLTFSGGFLTGTSTTGSLTATSTVKFTNYTSGALATDATGTLYTYSTSTWSFASSTLLADSNTWSGLQTFGNITASNATTTNLAVSGTASTTDLVISNVLSSLLKTSSAGLVSAAIAGTDYATPANIQTYKDWNIVGGALVPTSTIGVIINASSTINSLTTINSTSTNATTTNLAISGLQNALLATNANGSVVATTSLNITQYLNGVLPVANGGTGASSLSSGQLLYGAGTGAVQTVATGTVSSGAGISVTAGQYIIGSGLTITNTGVTSLAGTANQITASASTGAVTLSLPSHVIFPGTFEASAASTTNATSTNITATGIASTTALYISGIAANNILKTTTGGQVTAAVAGTDYENVLTFTYPLVRSTNTISLAFGTTTSNTWAGTQTFTNAPVITGFSGVVAASGGTTYSTATGTVTGSSQISVTAGQSVIGSGLAIDIVGDSIGDAQLAFNTGQNLTTASTPTFANLVVSGGATTTNLTISATASTTALIVSNLAQSAGQCLTSNAVGVISLQNCANFSYPFPSNATTTQIAFNGGLTAVGATTTALAVTGSSTVSSALNVGGAINAASTLAITGAITSTANTANTFPYASTTALTVSGTGYFETASTTNLTISGILTGNLLKTTTAGAITAAVAGTDYINSSYKDWNVVSGYLAPTTTLGVIVNASSTIGAGTQTGGLTVSGGATTTGGLVVQGGATTTQGAYFASNVAIGTTSPYSKLTVWGTSSLLEAVNSASTTIFSIGQGGATTTALSVSGTASSTSVVVSGLGNGTTQCVQVNGQGLLSGTGAACGSGGGGSDSNWQFFNTSGIRLATTSNQVLIGGTATTSATSKLEVLGGNILHTASGSPALATTNTTASQTYDVAIAGRLAYLADYDAGLRIIDISNPTSPTAVGSYSTGLDNTVSVVVGGRYAYIGDEAAGIKVIDVSAPGAPTLVGAYATGTFPYDLALSGKYLFATDFDSNELHIIDVSNPALPIGAAIYSTNLNQPYAVAVAGKYAYVANQGDGSIRVIDISNPVAPVQVGVYADGTTPAALYVSGKYLYVADADEGFYILDIDTPSSPAIVAGSTYASGVFYGVSVAGNYAYLSNHSGSVVVLNVATPTAVSLVGTLSTGGSPWNVAVSGKYAYVAADSSGLKIVDINGTQSPSAHIGALESSQINVSDDLTVGNNITAGGSLSVGISGIFSRGTIAAYVASSTQANPMVATLMGGNVGIGTTTAYSKMTVWGAGSLFEAVNNSSSTIFSIGQTGATTTNISVSGHASTTGLVVSGGATTTNLAVNGHASTTGLTVSGILSSLLKTNSTGQVIAAVAGTDYATPANIQTYKDWNIVGGALVPTTTLGVIVNASSTIGAGTQAGGLVISGGATTTGGAYIAGNLGVGVTSPTAKLDVSGSARICADEAGCVGSTGANTYALSLQNDSTNTWLEILNNGGVNKGIFFGITSNNFEQWNYQGGDILFYTDTAETSGKERLRITNTGNVGISTSSPFAKLSVHALATDTNTTLFEIASSTASATTTLFSVSNLGVASTSALVVSSGATTTNLAITALQNALLATNASGSVVATSSLSISQYLTGILPVANGGTGASSLSSGQLLYGAGTGAVQTVATGTVSGSNGIGVTAGQAIIGSGLTITGTNAAADAATKGVASFTAADFNDNGSGIISIDYTNGQAASASTKGFLTSADWSTFNNKVSSSSLETFASTYKDWNIVGGALVPTSSVGIIVSASSTIGSGTQTGGLTISGGATTTGDAYIAGNVGIGTNALIRKLDVMGSTRICSSDSGCVGEPAAFNYSLSVQNNSSLSWIEILNDAGANKGAFFGLTGDNFEQWNYQGGDIIFYTHPSVSDGLERLRITNTGNVGIGTSSPIAKFGIHADSSESNKTLFAIASSTASATTTLFQVSNTGRASTTDLTISSLGVAAGQCLTTNASGEVTSQSCSGTYDAWTHPDTGVSATTSGLIVSASSTIGSGTQTGGLTVSGGATTTGNAYVGGSLTVTGTAQANALTLTTDLAVQYGGTGVSTFGGTNHILYTTAADTLASEAGFTYDQSLNRLTVTNASTSQLSITGGLLDFTSAIATSTIKNNASFAWTLATSTTAIPLIQVDTTTGTETVTIGIAGSDVLIGGVGAAANLVFEESSTIHGQGGNTLTFGTTGDKINFAVNVGFGTTTPLAAVHADVVGTGDTAILGVGRNESFAGTVIGSASYRSANSGYYFFAGVSDYHGTPDNEFLMRGDGNGFLDGSWTAPADFAEWTRVEGDTQEYLPGDLVAFATTTGSSTSERRATKAVEGSTLLGVVTLKPGMVGVSYDISMDVTDAGTGSTTALVQSPSRTQLQMEQAYNAKMIALVGYTPIHVSTENGPLKAGDGITYSSTPGVGMKANAGDPIVGYAFEDFDPDNDKMGTHDVALPTFDASTTFRPLTTETETADGEEVWEGWVFAHVDKGFVPALTLEDMVASSTDYTAEEQEQIDGFWAGMFGKLAAWFADAGNGIADFFATTITAETVTASRLCLDDLCITKTELQALLNSANVDGSTPPPVEEDPATTTPPVDDGTGTTTPPTEEPTDEPTEEPSEGGEETPAEEPAEESTEDPGQDDGETEVTPEPTPEPDPQPNPAPDSESTQ